MRQTTINLVEQRRSFGFDDNAWDFSMDGQPVSRTVTIGLENGLHLVPCSRLVKLGNGLRCDVRLRKGPIVADVKNIFDLMSLAAAFGEQLEIVASGEGAADAVSSVARLFETNFAE